MQILLTDVAAKKISGALSLCTLDDPIASILWVLPNYEERYIRDEDGRTSISFEKKTEGFWGLGFNERSKIPPEYIKRDRGIEFLFTPEIDPAQISKVQIDFVNSEFIVTYDSFDTQPGA